MPKYCVNKNADPNGYHEVHCDGCDHLPEIDNQVDLGYHATCSNALKEAKRYFTSVDGCYYCCNSCHKH